MSNTTTEHSQPRVLEASGDRKSDLYRLIRSPGDAQIFYHNAVWFGSDESQETIREYEQLGLLVDKWGTLEFTDSNAETMGQLVEEMLSKRSCDLNNEYDGMGYGLAEALLQALVQAAKANTEVNR